MRRNSKIQDRKEVKTMKVKTDLKAGNKKKMLYS